MKIPKLSKFIKIAEKKKTPISTRKIADFIDKGIITYHKSRDRLGKKQIILSEGNLTGVQGTLNKKATDYLTLNERANNKRYKKKFGFWKKTEKYKGSNRIGQAEVLYTEGKFYPIHIGYLMHDDCKLCESTEMGKKQNRFRRNK